MARSAAQKIIDFLTFPLRAPVLFDDNRFGLTSLANERFDYVAKEVKGYCLDIGCGKYNKFITLFLGGNGIGIDVFKYEGLNDENIITDLTSLPYQDESFDTVTFIANVNHIPKPIRDKELSEAYRCVKGGGNIVVTMGAPFAEIAAHKVVAVRDKIFNSTCDVDAVRGMDDDEEYFLTDAEIRDRLHLAGFKDIQKKYFLTQWGLNRLYVAWK
jgi:SAM-dependent methyltransferase